MKKNLFILATLLAAAFCVNAQIDGTYKGDLSVNAAGTPSTAPNTEIYLTAETGGTYALSVKNFVFMDIPIGDLNVTGITAADDGNGNITLTKNGASTGPAVNIGMGDMPTNIYLTAAGVSYGILFFNLAVSAIMPQLGETQVAAVGFSGSKTSVGIFLNKAESIAIYPTVVEGDAEITVSGGLQFEEYAIFAQSGKQVKSGKLESGKISVGNLSQGTYILNVGGKTAKFVKK